jgi:hypothetical protein
LAQTPLVVLVEKARLNLHAYSHLDLIGAAVCFCRITLRFILNNGFGSEVFSKRDILLGCGGKGTNTNGQSLSQMAILKAPNA